MMDQDLMEDLTAPSKVLIPQH